MLMAGLQIVSLPVTCSDHLFGFRTLQDVQIYFQPHQNAEESMIMPSAISNEDFSKLYVDLSLDIPSGHL